MKTAGLAILITCVSAAEFPQASISNGQVRATLYLPDAEKGYYRATRFDWSGSIANLDYRNHSYFGVWFDRYDPKLHDSITGPVESFSPLGFEEAKPGETFIRIGVGVLKKPDDRPLSDFRTYEIVDTGKWSVHPGADAVEFTQDLPGVYVYRKTVRLEKDKPVMVIEHNLRNTGTKVIDTSVFNHDFYMLDGKPTGPDVVVKFPFEVRTDANWKDLAETRGKQIVYLKELTKGLSVYGVMQGYGNSASDFDIRVENTKSGAGVRQVGDQPISRLVYWSIRTTACPEAYNHLRIDPGRDITWRLRYEFYEVPPAQ
jgi:hypothetical protein